MGVERGFLFDLLETKFRSFEKNWNFDFLKKHRPLHKIWTIWENQDIFDIFSKFWHFDKSSTFWKKLKFRSFWQNFDLFDEISIFWQNSISWKKSQFRENFDILTKFLAKFWRSFNLLTKFDLLKKKIEISRKFQHFAKFSCKILTKFQSSDKNSTSWKKKVDDFEKTSIFLKRSKFSLV